MLGSYFRDKTLHCGEGHSWRAHRCSVLTLVVGGELREQFETEQQVCSGFAVHYKPLGAGHVTSTGEGGVRMLMLGIDESALPALGDCGQWLPKQATVWNEATLAARCLAAFQEVMPAQGNDRALGRHEVERVCGVLARAMPPGSSTPGTSQRRRQPTAWVSELHELLTRDAGASRSLRELATRFGLHPVHLARTFRRDYGITIGEYRRYLRSNRAVDLLASGEESLCAVAMESGFADQSHLSREFKQATGWTPGRFRGALQELRRNSVLR